MWKPYQKAKAVLKSDDELYVMMQIADAKHCFLSDLDDLPSEELTMWIAFYQIESDKRKKDEARNSSHNNAIRHLSH